MDNDVSIEYKYGTRSATKTATPTRKQTLLKQEVEHKKTIPFLSRLSSFSKRRRQNKKSLLPSSSSFSSLPFHPQNNDDEDDDDDDYNNNDESNNNNNHNWKDEDYKDINLYKHQRGTPDTEEETECMMTNLSLMLDVSLMSEPSNDDKNEFEIEDTIHTCTPPRAVTPPKLTETQMTSSPLSPDPFDYTLALISSSGQHGCVYSPQEIKKTNTKRSRSTRTTTTTRSRKSCDVSVEFTDLESEIELVMGNL